MPADALGVLADLVRIPSVNPMGQPLPALSAAEGPVLSAAEGSGPQYGEAQVAAYVAEYLRRCGLDVTCQEVLPGRANVLAVAEGRDRSQTLLLETHMDTVSAEHMTVPPFEAHIAGDRMYGRGACDAKASLAAMMTAFAAAFSKGTPPVNVAFCAAVDEERGFGGAAYLAESGFQATWAVVGEPTRLDVIVAHKGASRWRIRTQGRSAHASTPREGQNAIYAMARVVGALESYAAALGERPPHPQLGTATLNVGTIAGGETVNTVPAWCEISVDRRTLPGETPDDADQELRRRLREAGLDTACTITETLREVPFATSEQSRWAQHVLHTAQHVKPEAAFRHVSYATDASRLAEAGMSPVVVGPGDERQAHTADEWVALDDVRRAAALYEQLLTTPIV